MRVKRRVGANGFWAAQEIYGGILFDVVFIAVEFLFFDTFCFLAGNRLWTVGTCRRGLCLTLTSPVSMK